MTVSGPEGFQYNNPGYELHLTGLPEGELTFTLCAEKDPKAPSAIGHVYPEVLLIGAAVIVAAAVVIVFREPPRKREWIINGHSSLRELPPYIVLLACGFTLHPTILGFRE